METPVSNVFNILFVIQSQTDTNYFPLRGNEASTLPPPKELAAEHPLPFAVLFSYTFILSERKSYYFLLCSYVSIVRCFLNSVV